MRKGWKRVHRLVVLPNYQGIGIGTVFQDNIVQRYMDKFNVNCTTTTPALVNSLKRSLKWSLVRFSRVKNTLTKNLVKYYGQEKIRKDKGLGSSDNRITYSFNYKKEN
jgi:GNAT superfamily N-acetyltransferase